MSYKSINLIAAVTLLFFSSYNKTNCVSQVDEIKNIANMSFADLHRKLVDLAYDDLSEATDKYPSSLGTRGVKSLNGFFEFCVDYESVGFKEKWPAKSSLAIACKPSAYFSIPVPSAFNDLIPVEDIRNFVGWVWYERNFISQPDACASGEKSYLKFDNVNYIALVWLDGRYLGSHVGGHLPFGFDITEQVCSSLETGKRKELKLTIAISNELSDETLPTGHVEDLSELVGKSNFRRLSPTFDFFPFSGIMGDVSIVSVPFANIQKVLLSSIEIDWTPTSTHAKEAKLEFLTILNDAAVLACSKTNKTSATVLGDCKIEYEVFSPNKTLIYSGTSKWNDEKETESLERNAERLTLVVDRPELWSPYNSIGSAEDSLRRNYRAALYKLQIQLTVNRCNLSITKKNCLPLDTKDIYELQFGIREFKLTKSGLLLNNKPLTLTGFGYHEEHFPSGRYAPLAASSLDFQLFKQLYVNVIRTSHYPYSESFLDLADKNGIVIISEAPAVQLRKFVGCSATNCDNSTQLKLHKTIMGEMIYRDSNHASILAWSVANEPYSQLPEARAYFSELIESTRQVELDLRVGGLNRLITAAIAQSASDDTVASLLDFVMLNYYAGWYDTAGGVLRAVATSVKRWIASWAIKHPKKALLMSEFGAEAIKGLSSNVEREFGEDYQQTLLEITFGVFDELYASKSVSLIGELIWNFIDFDTSQSVSRVFGNHKGVFTANRQPKLAVRSIEKRFKNKLNQQQKTLVDV